MWGWSVRLANDGSETTRLREEKQMSPRESNDGVGSVLSWLFVAVVVLSAVTVPLATGPAKAAEAHIGISDVTVAPTEPTPGEQTDLEVTIRNGEKSPSVVDVTDVYVRRQGSPTDIARIEDVGTITIGSSISIPVAVSFDEPGSKNLRVVLVGRQNDGSHVRVRYPVTVDVKEVSRPQIELSTEEAVPGATRSVNVTVSNGLTEDIRQLRVVSSSPDVNFGVTERVKPRLKAGNATTFTFPARVDEAGSYPVNVTLQYSNRGEKHELTRTYRPLFSSPTNPGQVILTDVQATQAGGTLEISATAGNVGSDAVEGVVVSVVNSSSVERSNYFIGSIDGSDFSSFTLRTAAQGNVSSVPVEVRYSVGGVEKSVTTSVTVDRQMMRRPVPDSGSGGFPLLPVGGAAAVLLVGAAVYRWRS